MKPVQDSWIRTMQKIALKEKPRKSFSDRGALTAGHHDRVTHLEILERAYLERIRTTCLEHSHVLSERTLHREHADAWTGGNGFDGFDDHVRHATGVLPMRHRQKLRTAAVRC